MPPVKVLMLVQDGHFTPIYTVAAFQACSADADELKSAFLTALMCV